MVTHLDLRLIYNRNSIAQILEDDSLYIGYIGYLKRVTFCFVSATDEDNRMVVETFGKASSKILASEVQLWIKQASPLATKDFFTSQGGGVESRAAMDVGYTSGFSVCEASKIVLDMHITFTWDAIFVNSTSTVHETKHDIPLCVYCYNTGV